MLHSVIRLLLKGDVKRGKVTKSSLESRKLNWTHWKLERQSKFKVDGKERLVRFGDKLWGRE